MSEYITKCSECVGINGNRFVVPDYLDTSKEIVRCRDCKHCEAVDGMFGGESLACGRFDEATVKPDGFCAWGELRGDAE